MPFNLYDFRSSFGDRNIAKPSLFDFTLTGIPGDLTSEFEQTIRNIPLRCRASSLPGRSLEVSERQTNSNVRKVVYHKSKMPINLEIIEDSDLSVRRFFEAWHDFIIKSDDTGYPLEYYDNYVGEAKIKQYNDAGEMVYGVALEEVYPRTVNEMNLSWGAEEIHAVEVELLFKKWTLEE